MVYGKQHHSARDPIFFYPFKIGTKVKVVDGDNSAEGIVTSLSLFSIIIQREDG
ncbi:MAG: MscS family membrane protein [Cyclobacteriaceae bacterium]|jgi:MscS family membrane protein